MAVAVLEDEDVGDPMLEVEAVLLVEAAHVVSFSLLRKHVQLRIISGMSRGGARGGGRGGPGRGRGGKPVGRGGKGGSNVVCTSVSILYLTSHHFYFAYRY